MCSFCTLINKLDLKNLDSAICIACETEDKNIAKQIEVALKSEPAREDKWKCIICTAIKCRKEISFEGICSECFKKKPRGCEMCYKDFVGTE